MPASIEIFKPKSPSSTVRVAFDFLSDLGVAETLASTHSVTVSVYSGTDANPSALLSGSTSKSGTVVSQSITGGTAGNIYTLVCSCTTNNIPANTLIKVGRLAILPN